MVVPGRPGDGAAHQPTPGGMGELFPAGPGQPRLSCRGAACAASASSVAAAEVQGSWLGASTLPRHVPAPGTGAGGAIAAAAQRAVGARMSRLVREPDAVDPPVRFDER